MKSKLFIFLFIFPLAFITETAISQNTVNISPEPRLYECFDSAYVQRTLDRNPETIIYYNFYLDNSYYLSENNPEKPTIEAIDIFKVKKINYKNSGIPEFFNENLTTFDTKKFNPLKYEFAIDFNKYITYKLGNTGKLLVFYPKSVFIQMYNIYKKSFGY